MTVRIATSTGTDDHAVVQTEVDAASDGDTIQLVQADAGTPFDFGAAGQVTVGKSLAFVGVGSPLIEDGEACFAIDAVGKDVSFQGINFKNSTSRSIWAVHCNDITIENCACRIDSCYGRTVSEAGYDVFAAFRIASGGASSIGDITGNVSIQGNIIDLEASSDPNDPYSVDNGDGIDRSPLNGGLISEGGAWPGAGQDTPGAWHTWGVACAIAGPEGKKVDIKDNTIRNYSSKAITSTDVTGTAEIAGNSTTTPYGSHYLRSGNSSFSMLILNGFPPLMGNAGLRQAHGKWNVHNNNVVLTGLRCTGIAGFTFTGGPYKPEAVSCSKNDITHTTKGLFALWMSGVDGAYVGQNRLFGIGIYGMYLGWAGPSRFRGTDMCSLIGNNVSQFLGLVGAYVLSPDTRLCQVKGGGNVRDTVSDNGVLNTIGGGVQPDAQWPSGSILAIAKASLVDGETFTLDDGVNDPTVFEFDTDASVTGDNVAVDISGDTTAIEVADTMVAAINGVDATLALTASNGSGASALVGIDNDARGAAGLKTWSETVTNAGFIVTSPQLSLGHILQQIMDNFANQVEP